MAPLDQPSEDEPQARMSFGEHLEELRKRIFRAMIGSLFGIILCVVFYQVIVDIVVRPYKLVAIAHGLPPVLGTLKPQEGFLTTITLAFQAGLVLTSPWIIYQLWQFIAAGLYEKERKVVYRYTAPSAFLFLIGVAFFYFIVLPMTLNFFMGFSAHTSGPPPTPNWFEQKLLGITHHHALPAPDEPAASRPLVSRSPPAPATATAPATQPSPMSLPVLTEDPPPTSDNVALIYLDARDARIKIRQGDRIFTPLLTEQDALFSTTWRYDDYLSFVTFTALVFGLAFELPMVILILAQTGIVETQSFRAARKYAYFIIVIAAAIAAPSGDLMTLFCLAVPLIGLYELGIIAAAIAVSRQRRRAAE